MPISSFEPPPYVSKRSSSFTFLSASVSLTSILSFTSALRPEQTCLYSWFPPRPFHKFSTAPSHLIPGFPFVTFSHTALSAITGNRFFGHVPYLLRSITISISLTSIYQVGTFPVLISVLYYLSYLGILVPFLLLPCVLFPSCFMAPCSLPIRLLPFLALVQSQSSEQTFLTLVSRGQGANQLGSHPSCLRALYLFLLLLQCVHPMSSSLIYLRQGMYTGRRTGIYLKRHRQKKIRGALFVLGSLHREALHSIAQQGGGGPI